MAGDGSVLGRSTFPPTVRKTHIPDYDPYSGPSLYCCSNTARDNYRIFYTKEDRRSVCITVHSMLLYIDNMGNHYYEPVPGHHSNYPSAVAEPSVIEAFLKALVSKGQAWALPAGEQPCGDRVSHGHRLSAV